MGLHPAGVSLQTHPCMKFAACLICSILLTQPLFAAKGTIGVSLLTLQNPFFKVIGDSITDCGRRGGSGPLGDGYVRWFDVLLTLREPQKRVTSHRRMTRAQKEELLAHAFTEYADSGVVPAPVVPTPPDE